MLSPWMGWTSVLPTGEGPCCQTTPGQMLECRLQVQVPLALLGTCSSVAGLISRVAPALCSTSSPAWKCQRGTEGRACPVRPHLDEPWGTCGSYQQPRTCTATTMGGHVCVCVVVGRGWTRSPHKGPTPFQLFSCYWMCEGALFFFSQGKKTKADSLRFVVSACLCTCSGGYQRCF